MPTYTKHLLSQSTNGRHVTLGATMSPGTLIHTAVSGTTDYDEIWIWAYNDNPANYTVTVEWGSTGSSDCITSTLASKGGYISLVPGLLLNNSTQLRCYSGTVGGVAINGFVNRISS